MRLGLIVTKLRLANTTFGNYIGGAAELALAIRNTLQQDSAFVIPLAESADPNQTDSTINQTITERFGVVVALANDSKQSDKLGLTAYDRLHDIRSELFRALVGTLLLDSKSYIDYRGGRILDINPAYLWYQFEFEYQSQITSYPEEGYCDLEDKTFDDIVQPSQLDDFNSMYVNFVLSPNRDPNRRMPITDIPLDDNYPDVTIPDMANWIDLTDDPRYGEFGEGFASSFDFYDKDRR